VEIDSFPSSPDPNHIPVPHSYSPGMESPGVSNEKDRLGDYVATHYPSQANLAPGVYETRVETVTTTSRSKKYQQPRTCVPTNPTKRRWLFIGLPIVLFLIAGIIIGVIVATSHKPTGNASNAADSPGSPLTPSAIYNRTQVPIVAGAGETGSTITTDKGETFVYTNTYGGNWNQDPGRPYTVSAVHHHHISY
jgi:glucan 1,3-beta-glucosidase